MGSVSYYRRTKFSFQRIDLRGQVEGGYEFFLAYQGAILSCYLCGSWHPLSCISIYDELDGRTKGLDSCQDQFEQESTLPVIILALLHILGGI